MNALLKLMRYSPFLGQGGSGGGSSEPVDFLTLKTTMTEYRNDDIKSLPVGAFCGCSNLKYVTLPDGVEINDLAFGECPNLKVVDILGTPSHLTPRPNGTEWVGDYSCLVIRGEPPYIKSTDNSAYELRRYNFILLPREYVRIIEDAYDNFEESPYGSAWNYIIDAGLEITSIEYFTVDGTVTGELDMEKIYE